MIFEAAPSLGSVTDAARRLAGAANRTPVVTSRTLDSLTSSSVFLKCENFQRSGSFKFRGAYNAVSRLADKHRETGVLTYSSGNHAQALALVGRLTGVPVTVVMPTWAPEVKRLATEGYGARIVLYDPEREEREAVAERILATSALSLIPPFDHPDIVSGQGTAGLELLEEVDALDMILVPCGGGGLLAGTAIAATSAPGCVVIGVEPELADDATRTFRTGVLHTAHNPPTIADGLRTPSLGDVTWPIIQARVDRMLTVSETEIVTAMHFLWTRTKLLVEPSGAVALAALLHRPELGSGLRVGVIVSGGNVDISTACRIFQEHPSGS